MFSLRDADLRDITLSTWFFKTKKTHQSRQRLVGEQQKNYFNHIKFGRENK